MPQDEAVYDLGDVDLRDRKTTAFPSIFDSSGGGSRRERLRYESRTASRVGPQLAGSLSLFVPGLGHVAAGEIAWGLFYATSLGFCVSAIWTAIAMRDRLLATLHALDLRLEGLLIALVALAITAMLLHLASIAHAQSSAGGVEAGDGTHPIVAGLASLLVPGWGQILAGHPRRATLFVGSLWLIGGAWLAATDYGVRALALLGIEIPPALRDDWGVAILIAAPAIVWIVAIYDAASGARR